MSGGKGEDKDTITIEEFKSSSEPATLPFISVKGSMECCTDILGWNLFLTI